MRGTINGAAGRRVGRERKNTGKNGEEGSRGAVQVQVQAIQRRVPEPVDEGEKHKFQKQKKNIISICIE